MGRIKYNHAIDENGNLISINNVEKNGHHGRLFKCVHCGGAMSAKFSREDAKRKMTPHFSHKICDCSYESYIHSLAKRILVEKYKQSDSFIIEMKRYAKCNERDTCPIKNTDECFHADVQSFNLKPYYNIVSEEKQYDGFVADVLLKDNTDKHQPIFFEIKYKHACTSQKIASGNMIIEIDVNTEEDLISALSYNIKESDTVRFWGFDRMSKIPSDSAENVYLQHFALFRTGKAKVPELHEFISCKRIVYAHSIFEIVFQLDYFGFPTPYEYGYIAALKEGFDVKSCQLCKYRKDGYEYGNNPHFCCLYKKRMVGKENEKFLFMYPDATDAIQCEYFVVNQELVRDVKELFVESPYKRLK